MDIFIQLLPLALAIIMLSLGLGLTVADFARVLTAPRAFVIGLISQVVAIPLVAWVLASFAGLPPALAVGVMILALCPGGVTSNVLTRFAHGDLALSISLTGLVSLLSVLTVPVLAAFFADHFMGLDAPAIDVTALGLAMFAMTAVPVAIGMTVRRFAPGFSARAEGPLSVLALVLFVLIVIGAIVLNWSLLVENLPRLGPSLVALNVVLLAIGLGLARLAGLSQRQGTAIAIETGIQNSTLGITVGSLIVEQASGLPPFSLPSGVYGLTMYAVALPFIFWRRAGQRKAAPLSP
ncbi:bile acid:sodium symporter family protein [Minwuia thermotolerans]|uniref:Bile acid:sodium symporter n=1 Tax=Minwuia thermotolerans TaxID=2056226 RepID=A0A2M9FXN9_9PROT|nr:bile acid:sodium symporter family protein [Minwuia thermotolerans]PJK28226.1 bile acid:sodium symporter [Minwuia thermotolerans]